MKKSLMVILITLLVLTGCSKKKPIANEDGSILSYKVKDAEPGYYIKEGDKVYPLLDQGITKSPKLMQWSKKYDQIIPTLTKENELIYISDKEVPSVFEFTKMEDFGYTIGTMFNLSVDENGKEVITFSSNSDPTSAVADRVEAIDRRAVVTEINSLDFTSDLLSPEGLVRGLEQDGLYMIYYYVGTMYQQVQLKAETRVFISDYSLMSTSYIPQKNNHFVIETPEELEKGYYIIDEGYMFYYDG